jgi:hypothetical protein
MNLNKYINDAKGSNEKLLTYPHKPDIPQTSKSKKVNINKLNEMINSKPKNVLVSPRNASCPNEDDITKEKEVLSFLANLGGKFDEELENLVEIENLLINAKLDIKLSEKCETKLTIERNEESHGISSERNSLRNSYNGPSRFKPPISHHFDNFRTALGGSSIKNDKFITHK